MATIAESDSRRYITASYIGVIIKLFTSLIEYGVPLILKATGHLTLLPGNTPQTCRLPIVMLIGAKQLPAMHRPLQALPAQHCCPGASVVSHPLTSTPSQSPVPGRHRTAHVVPLHDAVPLLAPGHAAHDVPQLKMLSLGRHCVPHRWYPLAQAPAPHTPIRQLGVALAATRHVVPQRPQFAMDVAKALSQPLLAVASQSP